MRQAELHLTDEERELVDTYRAKGLHHAREVNRAHILSALDRGVPGAQIMAVLGVGRTAIWRTRSACLDGGVAYALQDVARPGKPRRHTTDVEAQVVALACSEPPVGAKRWTLELLEQAAQAQADMGPISRETIRRLLKKNRLKLWRRLMVALPCPCDYPVAQRAGAISGNPLRSHQRLASSSQCQSSITATTRSACDKRLTTPICTNCCRSPSGVGPLLCTL